MTARNGKKSHTETWAVEKSIFLQSFNELQYSSKRGQGRHSIAVRSRCSFEWELQFKVNFSEKVWSRERVDSKKFQEDRKKRILLTEVYSFINKTKKVGHQAIPDVLPGLNVPGNGKPYQIQ